MRRLPADDVAFCRRLQLDGWEHLHDDDAVVVLSSEGAPEVAERALRLYRPELPVRRAGDDAPGKRVLVTGSIERGGRLRVTCQPFGETP